MQEVIDGTVDIMDTGDGEEYCSDVTPYLSPSKSNASIITSTPSTDAKAVSGVFSS